MQNDNINSKLVTIVSPLTILGWPSDTFAIDFEHIVEAKIHTVLVFTPGNPGLMEWYIPFFQQIMQQLGPGYACRGVANATHSLDPQKVHVESGTVESAIPWTVDGQAWHKCAFVDAAIFANPKLRKAKLIFVSHSIGCHFTQRMCVLRRDILQQTRLFLHLMPFVRMKAPAHKALILDFLAARPEAVIQVHERLLRGLAAFPLYAVDALLVNTMNDKDGRRIAAQLLQIPEFARNFFTLGLEEIRDVPEEFDVCAMRYLGQQCATYFLYAGNDHWSPEFHMNDLKHLQRKGVIPNNIYWTHLPHLKHDFVSDKHQVPIVVQYCVDCIEADMQAEALKAPKRSKL